MTGRQIRDYLEALLLDQIDRLTVEDNTPTTSATNTQAITVPPWRRARQSNAGTSPQSQSQAQFAKTLEENALPSAFTFPPFPNHALPQDEAEFQLLQRENQAVEKQQDVAVSIHETSSVLTCEKCSCRGPESLFIISELSGKLLPRDS